MIPGFFGGIHLFIQISRPVLCLWSISCARAGINMEQNKQKRKILNTSLSVRYFFSFQRAFTYLFSHAHQYVKVSDFIF